MNGLVERLGQHVLQYGPAVGQICSCGYAPRRAEVDPDLLLTQQDIHRTHLADVATSHLAAAIEARADELAGNGRPALGHPVLIERDGYVSGLRAAAEIVRRLA